MKDQTVTSQLCVIEELIKSRRFADALVEISRVCESSLEADEFAFCAILESEAKLYIGIYDIEEILGTAIEFYRYHSDHNRYARAKFLYGWMLEAKGNVIEAREALLEAYTAYKRCQDLEGGARCLNRLAYVAYLSGEINLSVSWLKQCIPIYEQLSDRINTILVKSNLSAVYLLTGSVNQALEELNSINPEYMMERKDNLCSYYLRMSLIYAHLNKCEIAFVTLSKAKQFSEGYLRLKALYCEYFGWIHILDGNFKQAEKTLLTGLELSMEIAPESALISQTKRLLADAYLGLKKYDLAHKYAEEALIVAEKINERAEIAACYRVFAHVCLHNDEGNNAKEWFRKAIDLFSMIKSRYELAVTRYLFASSELCDHNERTAQLYLAKEYFESEEIRPYIDKVYSELSSISGPKLVSKQSGNGAPVFIAESSKTKDILKEAERLSRSDLTVLITGPTGSGKDQLAKYMHYVSNRSGQYCSVTCASLNESIIESELFGHVKGAFTGADRDKPGLLEKADKGTLCLNEIGDMPERIQIRLLEFLDSKEVRPVGCTEWKKLDVKIIAATNRDLEAAIKSGHFRSDLFYRLNHARIILLPLSERREDIPALAMYYLKILGLDIGGNGDLEDFDRLCQFLTSCDWPGNVRELESRIKKLYDDAGGNLIRMAAILESETFSERERLIKILEQTGWNQREAARRLNMTEGGVRYLIKKHSLSKGSDA